MTETLAVAVADLTVTALTVLAEARWPESPDDLVPPPLPGFVVSSFSATVAEVAGRCMSRRGPSGADVDRPLVTAVVLASALGDVASAVHVAEAVDAGRRIGPLLFFQSVPNSVAGHVAARWQLTGPIVSVGSLETGLDVAALMVEDGDADEVLLIRIEQDSATAVLLSDLSDLHDLSDRAEAESVAEEER